MTTSRVKTVIKMIVRVMHYVSSGVVRAFAGEGCCEKVFVYPAGTLVEEP